MAQGLALVGAAFVLSAFGALQFGRMTPQQLRYQAINLAGGSMLCGAAVLTQMWGFVVLNAVWAGVAVVKLAEIYGRRSAGATVLEGTDAQSQR